MSVARSGGRDARVDVAVVDYNAGNITSLLKGLTAAGANAFLTNRPEDLYDCDRIVIPGVGHFQATASIDLEVRRAIQDCAGTRKPILGICLGMQFLYAGSEEAPGLEGLELLPGQCALLRGDVKVPHVGWNTATLLRESTLLEGLRPEPYFYFTHSYAAPIADATVGVTSHGTDFAAIVDNGGRVFGVQFHPEKSGPAGIRILENFVRGTRC